MKVNQYVTITVTFFAVLILGAKVVSAQQLYCAPNSLPRSCGGYSVCTISGNCGFLQNISCCITSQGFPSNTPTGVPPAQPTPTDIPIFGTPSPTPTAVPSYYGGSLLPWYTHDLSTTSETIEQSIIDSSAENIYIVGRQNIGDPEGWSQSSKGFIKKVKISDKSVLWTKTMGSYLGYYTGGLYDISIDGSGVYVSGYTDWGKSVYYAKLSLTTGAVIWEKATDLDSYWNIEKGYGIKIDNNYAYIISGAHDGVGPDTPENLGSNSKWVVLKVDKNTGSTVSTRNTQLSAGEDVPRSLVLSGNYVFVGGEKNGLIYVEKLNKSNLSLVTSATSSQGSITKSAMTLDGSSVYLAGVVGASSSSRLQLEKRPISNLSLSWKYNSDITGTTHSNARITLKNSSIILVSNHTINSGKPAHMRVLYIATSSGASSKNNVYTSVGYVGSVWYGSSTKTYVAGATEGGVEGAIYELDQIDYTPTPTPSPILYAGCNALSWANPNNVIVTNNSFAGNIYESWNFENGAVSNYSSSINIGGYTEIPSLNPNYGAMWGLSLVSSDPYWVDYAWYVPYYSGNEMYIMLPGRYTIPMGTANAGEKYIVQKSGANIIFAKLSNDSSTWENLYVISGDLSGDYYFNARVAGYSQIYKAYAGTTCQPALLPTTSPLPTLAPNVAIEPWYSANFSSFPEFGYAAYPDETGEYLYLVGRKDIGRPYGWHQSSVGYIKKIKVEDKSIIWTREIDSGLYESGLYDVKVDGEDLFVTGYKMWGTNLYAAKININTGSVIWSTQDNLGWSWLPWKGLDFDMDDEYLYITSNKTQSDQDAEMALVKKRRSNGATVASRYINPSNNDWDGYTNVLLVGNYLYVGGYINYKNPTWYLEKLNKSDLSLVTFKNSVQGVNDIHSMVTDGVYLYTGGFEKISGGTMWASSLETRVHIEKRRLSDLELIWAYNAPQRNSLQGSTALAIYNGEILATANDSIDRVGWFGSSWMGNNLRFIRINKDTGQELFSGLYQGVGNVGSIEKDSSGAIYLAGATANTLKTAIFKINDILYGQTNETYGLSVTQSLVGTSQKGMPIKIHVDITNDSVATQAGWAFEFINGVSSSIVGVSWSCDVVNYGNPRGDMYQYPTRCGAVSSGTGNSIQFSHSSQADPLIQPGGILRITIDGVLATNSASKIENTAMIKSYIGWPENHYYTLNFISSPGDYTTFADNNTSDNSSTLEVDVSNAFTPTPLQTIAPGISPTSTPIPTPTTPIHISNLCFDSSQVLRLFVDGRNEYYCEDVDATGHNLIIVRNSEISKLNTADTAVENVKFKWGQSFEGYKLLDISFDARPRKILQSERPQKRSYKSTMRVKSP